ncbi:MAG: YggT family protein [Myxococcales bacterium]|nr:YggT family protein [Myxococcales bacterium]
MIVIAKLISLAVNIYSLMMLVWVAASWVPSLKANRLVQQIGKLCEPPLERVRRVVPPIGGIDFSPLVVILALHLLARLLIGLIT